MQTNSTQISGTLDTDVSALIKKHELQIRRLKAINKLAQWVENIKTWHKPDKVKIERYQKAGRRLLKLYLKSL
jgi:hypothetical protein